MRRLGCPKQAKWEIRDPSEAPDLATQACTEHVGELLHEGVNYVWPVEH